MADTGAVTEVAVTVRAGVAAEMEVVVWVAEDE